MRGAVLHGYINNSAISIHLTEKAMTHLEHANHPIYVGMELYFNYFMQKKVVFLDEEPENEVTKITDELYMYFKPIHPKRGKMKDLEEDRVEMEEMPVTRRGALVPKYIKLDFKRGRWQGDFTWKSGNEFLKPLILNYN